jgi:hypothetical protein
MVHSNRCSEREAIVTKYEKSVPHGQMRFQMPSKPSRKSTRPATRVKWNAANEQKLKTLFAQPGFALLKASAEAEGIPVQALKKPCRSYFKRRLQIGEEVCEVHYVSTVRSGYARAGFARSSVLLVAWHIVIIDTKESEVLRGYKFPSAMINEELFGSGTTAVKADLVIHIGFADFTPFLLPWPLVRPTPADPGQDPRALPII